MICQKKSWSIVWLFLDWRDEPSLERAVYIASDQKEKTGKT